MADRKSCDDPKPHDPHGWVDGYWFTAKFHVCQGVPDDDLVPDD